MIKAHVKNFEIIEDAKVEISGLTAITGESNNGKTALYNSLKVLAYNIQGRGYIRKVGGDEVKTGCESDWEFDDGVHVVFRKADAPVYDLKLGDNSTTFDKAGRGPIPELVGDALNVRPVDLDGTALFLNFVDQLASPLLKTLSDYQLYKLAVKSYEGEKLRDAIKLVEIDKTAKEQELKNKYIEIEVQKKNRLSVIDRQELYTPLEYYRGFFNAYEQQCALYPKLVDLNTRYTEIINERNNSDVILNVMSQLPEIIAYQESVERGVNDLKLLQGVYNQKESLRLELEGIENELTILGNLNFGSLDEYKLNIDSLETVTSFNNRLNTLEVENTYLEQSFAGIAELDSVVSQVTTFSKSMDQYSYLTTISNQRVQAVAELCYVSDLLLTLENIPDYTDYSNNTAELNRVTAGLERINQLSTGINEYSEQLESLEKEITDLQYVIDNNLCPYCKSEQTECKH